MPFLLDLAWRDMKASGRSLWVFCVCLLLGVTLVAASGGLYGLISAGLLADTRALMGGDLEVDTDAPLPGDALDWMEQRGDISLVTEIDTMLGTENDDFRRVELQTVDERYPLYGQLLLEPLQPLAAVTSLQNDRWGVAIDPVLAETLGIGVGDLVYIGSLAMEVRALIRNQPDRSLNADWRGTPVLVSPAAIDASGLLQPGSRIDYEYRVRTDIPVADWREAFYNRFPDQTWEVRTFHDRSRRIGERLDQIASGLLIIGFSTLFIGGLGVFNSIQAYLQGKLKTIATLRALGLRNHRLATVYLLQVGILSGGASLLGALLGGGLALLGATVIAARMPVDATALTLVGPVLVAITFGLLTAFAFALPALGRALSVQPAALFRGSGTMATRLARPWWLAALVCGTVLVLLVLIALPDIVFGFGFVTVVGILLLLLDLVVRGIRWLARRLDDHAWLTRRFDLRLALANLHRPGSPLRASLLSLGSALTLLVACTVVVASLVRTLNSTIPEESPALVLYDIADTHLESVRNVIAGLPGTERVETAPLVRSRIIAINGSSLDELDTVDREQRRDAAQEDFELSYSANNIDAVTLVDGAWWQEPVRGLPQMAMEDREAEELGLEVDDVVTFFIEGQTLDARIVAIFSQKGIQTKFWFEAILSGGALDGFIHRHVGAAYMDHADAITAERRIAVEAPGVITVRTATLLASARGILGKATAGLAVVAGVSLAASLLVLVSVMAAGRTRQIYDATVLHSLGTRLAVIRRSLRMEYVLLAFITSVFSVALGSAIALPLLHLRLKLPSEDLLWLGAVTAVTVSGLSLSLGARYLFRRLQPTPAVLLRGGN